MTATQLHDEVVLIRTHAGARAMLDDLRLDADRHRLLSLVNGYTPLSALSTRLNPGRAAADALELLDLGLVCVRTEIDVDPIAAASAAACGLS